MTGCETATPSIATSERFDAVIMVLCAERTGVQAKSAPVHSPGSRGSDFNRGGGRGGWRPKTHKRVHYSLMRRIRFTIPVACAWSLMMFVHYPMRRPVRRLPGKASRLAAWVTRWHIGKVTSLASRQPSHMLGMGVLNRQKRPRAHFLSARCVNLITAAGIGLVMLLLLAYILTDHSA